MFSLCYDNVLQTKIIIQGITLMYVLVGTYLIITDIGDIGCHTNLGMLILFLVISLTLCLHIHMRRVKQLSKTYLFLLPCFNIPHKIKLSSLLTKI